MSLKPVMAVSTYRALRAGYNLDDPLLVQYAKYLGGLVRGDFGTNFNG
jgi:oligopeptide transport system permease protein